MVCTGDDKVPAVSPSKKLGVSGSQNLGLCIELSICDRATTVNEGHKTYSQGTKIQKENFT